MSVERRRSDCTGCRWQMGAGGSIGHARTGVRDQEVYVAEDGGSCDIVWAGCLRKKRVLSEGYGVGACSPIPFESGEIGVGSGEVGACSLIPFASGKIGVGSGEVGACSPIPFVPISLLLAVIVSSSFRGALFLLARDGANGVGFLTVQPPCSRLSCPLLQQQQVSLQIFRPLHRDC